MKILIVDDDSFSLDVLEGTLAQNGHEVVRAPDGKAGLDILRQGELRLVITDWDMPGMSGLDFCRAIRSEDLNGYVYIIMLTGHDGAHSRREGLRAGADDFLNKPMDPEELLVCLTTAERILSLETRDVALFALAKLAESRDPEIGGHIERVQNYSRLLIRNLSAHVKQMHGADAEYVRLIYQTSPLHDLGKVGIPDSVLLKPGKLAPEEFEIMKTHAVLGARTLDAALQRFPNVRFLQMARDIAATHHEKFDGTGYPCGLAGEQIPLCGRIVALADVYDALTSRRIYKEAMSHEEAKESICSQRGKHFDPDVVDAFLKAEQDFLIIANSIRDDAVPVAAKAVADAALSGPQADSTSTVLVVDDSPFVLKKLIDVLGAGGHTVISASNAAEALELFILRRPGVIVSDWEMPGDSGVELCRQVRRSSAQHHVHFIMLTSHSEHPLMMEAYEAGVDDFVRKPFNDEELLARARVGLRIHRLHEELNRQSETQKILNLQLAGMNTRLNRLSITDELTGLYNRRHAMARLEEQWALAERYNGPLAVAMVDIDHFKRVNDTFGHDAGDIVLRQVAMILREMTRATDVICRVGGEEFLILFPSETTKEAAACAERCRIAVVTHTFRAAEADIPVSISIGVAGRTAEMKQASDCLRLADEMLYDAKHAGRNRVHIADQSTEDETMTATALMPSLPEEIPAFNAESVLQRCGGDAQFAAAVTEKFRKQAPTEMGRLDAALAAGDVEVFRRTVHGLKSMAAFVSADQAADFSKQLEDLARTNQLAEVGPLMQRLHEEISRVVTGISSSAELPRAKCA